MNSFSGAHSNHVPFILHDHTYSPDSTEEQYPVNVTNNQYGFDTSPDRIQNFGGLHGTAYDWNISSNAPFNVDYSTIEGYETFMPPYQPLLSDIQHHHPSAMNNLGSAHYVNDPLNTYNNRPTTEQALNNTFSTFPTPQDPQVQLPEHHTTTTPQNLASPSQSITSPSQSTTTSPPEPLTPTTPIGLVLLNGTYLCTDAACKGRTYGRYTELKRHHTGRHAIDKPTYWCEADDSCPRSEARGKNPFYRKDKLVCHLRSMHGEG